MVDTSKLKRMAIQSAQNREAKINGPRLSGHTFVYSDGAVHCMGCRLSAQAGWKNGSYLYGEAARDLVKQRGDCTNPWDLKKRLAEIEAQYAPKTEKTEKGDEITLATINAKLDKIIKRLGIW